MSSKTKRSLYKPVPSIVPKKNRKPLAQGRLVTEGNACDIKKKTSFNLKGSQNKEENIDISVTPRKNVMKIDEVRSPQPTSRLDLSDLDIDDPGEKSVIVIDASDNLLKANECEVSYQIEVKKSPVRVVCHVDKETSSEKQNQYDEMNQLDFRKTQLSIPKAISPLVKDIPRSANKYQNTSQTKHITTSRGSKPNYPQPNFNDSQEWIKTDKVGDDDDDDDDDDDVQFIVSDIDACSIDEYLPVIKSKTTQRKTSSKNSTLKNKTAATIIPSRYMQTASRTSSSFTNQRNTSRKVKSTASNNSLPCRSSSQPRATTAMLQPHTTNHKSSTPSVLNQAARSVTPNIHAPTQTIGGKTSTPCSNETLSNQTQDIDASAIQAEISAISADFSNLTQTRKMNSSNITKKHRPKKEDIKKSQQKLDVLWCRYLQWLYLDSKAKTVYKEQEKTAMSQLNSLWEELESKREREASLKLDLVRLKHLNHLDDQIEKQRDCLRPVIHNLPIIDDNYKKLAESLDTTRHQILTKGIYIPDDEETFQASLENVLKESEYLLGEISGMVRQEIPKTSQFSNSLQTTKKLVDAECLELQKCTELLSATQSLAIQESSLKIQAIQSI